VGSLEETPSLPAVSSSRTVDAAPRRLFGFVSLVLLGIGAIILVTAGLRLQQHRPKKTVALTVTRPQRNPAPAAVAAAPPAPVAMQPETLVSEDPQAVQLN